MNNHLNDADLVALALLPDESPDARLHLASCTTCRARMEIAENELERQRRAHETSIETHDATFWKRQELTIMREVSRSGRHTVSARRSLVAAALLTVAIGGFWFGRLTVDTPHAASTASTIAHVAPTTPTPDTDAFVPATAVSTNPWDADALTEFEAVVDWESWVDEDGKDQGTI